MACWKGTLAALVTLAAVAGPVSSSMGAPARVVVPRGGPVQIAVVLDTSDSIGATYSAGIHNAIQMAVALQRSIRGFPIELNDGFDAPCLGDDASDQNAAAARAVVANTQNVAVLGHFCSSPFAGAALFSGPCPAPSPTSALATYEQHGLATINGSTTSPCLTATGPTTFNATTVPDPGSDIWYAQITSLPSDHLWQLLYRIEFGVAPTPFADLYFDATRLLLTRLEQTSRVVGGALVIDRAALAQALRHTVGFPGVTCSITLDPTTGFRVDDPASLARCASPLGLHA
jgi:ABC-type branched-subunit amino acid transport system substrate-binding protein